jgi:hypothetical protein
MLPPGVELVDPTHSFSGGGGSQLEETVPGVDVESGSVRLAVLLRHTHLRHQLQVHSACWLLGRTDRQEQSSTWEGHRSEDRTGRGGEGDSLVSLEVGEFVGVLQDAEVSALPLAHAAVLLLIQPALQRRGSIADRHGWRGRGGREWLLFGGSGGGVAGATEAEGRGDKGLRFGGSQGRGLIWGTGDLESGHREKRGEREEGQTSTSERRACLRAGELTLWREDSMSSSSPGPSGSMTPAEGKYIPDRGNRKRDRQ